MERRRLAEELHCALKHYSFVIENLGEILEKLIRLYIRKEKQIFKDYIDKVTIARHELRALYYEVLKVNIDLFDVIIDKVRQVRGLISVLEREAIFNKDFELDDKMEHALLEDILDCKGNLYAIEKHLITVKGNYYYEHKKSEETCSGENKEV